MTQCHKCGRRIEGNASVYRLMKTGSYSSGHDYFRNVNLCRRCDDSQDAHERLQRIKKVLFVLAAVSTVVGGAVYWWLRR